MPDAGDEELQAPDREPVIGRRSPGLLWLYLVVVLAMSIPFWLLGLAGPTLPLGLPLSALMFVVPGAAAGLLGARSRWRPARDHVERPVGSGRWWFVAIGLMPAVYAVAWLVRAAFGIVGGPLELGAAPGAAVGVFVVAAFCEELGWTVYATPAARQVYSEARTGLLIGTAWAVWHVVPYLQAGHGGSWILWQCVVTIAARVILVAMFERAGRRLALATVFHASINLGLLPVTPDFYSPAASAAFLVPIAWWTSRLPRTRARDRDRGLRTGDGARDSAHRRRRP